MVFDSDMLPNLVLGSSSPYRKELLSRLHLTFITDSPSIDETPLSQETPEALTVRLAREKALAVHAKHPDSFVIGSDQAADLNGEILGKPGTKEKAVAQLTRMQGQKLTFWTAVCVINPAGLAFEALVPTTVEMKTLSQEAICRYVELENPVDCAGAAKIEKLGVVLMRRVSSDDPTALIGLPLIQTASLLVKSGYPLLPGLSE